jgi:hypothetical protein
LEASGSTQDAILSFPLRDALLKAYQNFQMGGKLHTVMLSTFANVYCKEKKRKYLNNIISHY